METASGDGGRPSGALDGTSKGSGGEFAVKASAGGEGCVQMDNGSSRMKFDEDVNTNRATVNEGVPCTQRVRLNASSGLSTWRDSRSPQASCREGNPNLQGVLGNEYLKSTPLGVSGETPVINTSMNEQPASAWNRPAVVPLPSRCELGEFSVDKDSFFLMRQG